MSVLYDQCDDTMNENGDTRGMIANGKLTVDRHMCVDKDSEFLPSWVLLHGFELRYPAT